MMKRAIAILLAFSLLLSMAACSSKLNSTPKNDSSEPAKEKTITVMHNRPDDTDPLNKYYEETRARFEEANPGVKVEYEVYDNETYKKKLQIYGSSKTMPDVFFTWSNPSEFLPYVNAELAAELNPQDFADYKFLPGALDGSTVNGKLYGLPIGIDYWYLFCNKKVFEENGVELPKTIGDLKQAIEKFNKAGVAPIAMNGKDLWNQAVLFNDILFRHTNGDRTPILNAITQKTKFAETPEFITAANTYKELVDLGMFENSWTSVDGATAKNMFLQGKSAMYYIGTWENSICTSEDTPKELRDNLAIIPFPSVDGTDTSKALMGREGTTMMVSSNSPNKEEATNFLKAFFDPEYFPKESWEKGLGIPMQSFSKYVKDSDAAPLKEVSYSINTATSIASHPFTFGLSAVFEQESKDLIMQFLLGQIDAKQLWEQTDKAAAENQIK